MSAKDENEWQQHVYNHVDGDCVMGNGCEPTGTSEKWRDIRGKARVVQIAMVMRRRRLEWFGHVKRRDETENIRAVTEMKMDRKRPRGRPKLRWKDTVRSDMKDGMIREKWKGLHKTCYTTLRNGSERWEEDMWLTSRCEARRLPHRTTNSLECPRLWSTHTAFQESYDILLQNRKIIQCKICRSHEKYQC